MNHSGHRRRRQFEIYQLILELAKKDKGIVIISSEMPELLGITGPHHGHEQWPGRRDRQHQRN
jgi:hypothetical protein